MFAALHRFTSLGLLLAAFLLAVSVSGTALAQPAGIDGTGETPPDTVQQLEDLVRTIEDPQRREQLLQQLNALIEARQAQQEEEAADRPGLFARLADQVDRLGDQFAEAVHAFSDLGQITRWARAQTSDPEKRQLWIEAVWKILAAVLAGLVAEALLVLLLRGARRRIEARAPDGVFTRLLYLALRTVLDVIPIAGFAGAAYVTLPFLRPGEPISGIALAIILASVLVRAVNAVARLLLTPRVPALRVFNMTDETARYLFVWVGRYAAVIVYGYFALVVARELGMPQAAFEALMNVLGLIVAGMVLVFIMQNRGNVAAWLRGERAAGREAPEDADRPAAGRRFQPLLGVRRRLADIWHILASLYVLVAFVIWLLKIGGGFTYLATATGLTALAVFVAWLIHSALQRALNRALRVDPSLAAESPGLEARSNRYLPFLRAGVTVLVNAVALLAILQIWGADILGWLRTEPGREALGSVVTIIVILVAALVLWEFASRAIERYLQRESEKEEGDRVARVETLLPLARNAILVILVIVVAMTVMTELGIDIGPLLAGAGVVGLAIGFGAQSLVKDLITGIFNLVEDTISVGDIVDVGGGHIGVVESVSIRSVRLRDYSGIVHTVPFGEVTSVENYTKDFAYAMFDIGVAYRENIDEVMEIMRETGAEMRDDPDYRADIFDELEIAGLNEFGDSAILIRARFRVKGGRQWAVRREYFRRIKAAFDARGIEIPFPHVTLYFGEDKEGGAPPGLIRLLQNSKPNDPPPNGPPSTDDGPADQQRTSRRATPLADDSD